LSPRFPLSSGSIQPDQIHLAVESTIIQKDLLSYGCRKTLMPEKRFLSGSFIILLPKNNDNLRHCSGFDFWNVSDPTE
jgi:hypothetical protein